MFYPYLWFVAGVVVFSFFNTMIFCILFYSFPRMYMEKRRGNLKRDAVPHMRLSIGLILPTLALVGVYFIIQKYLTEYINVLLLSFVCSILLSCYELIKGYKTKRKLNEDFINSYGDLLKTKMFDKDKELAKGFEKIALKNFINQKVNNFLENEAKTSIKDGVLGKDLKSFKVFEDKNYTQLITDFQNSSLEIYTRPILKYDLYLLNIIGSPIRINTYKWQTRFWPTLGFILNIGISIIFSNYWLMFGLLLFPFAQIVSGTARLLRILGRTLQFISLISSTYFVYSLKIEYLAITLPYIIWYTNFKSLRLNYRSAIIEAATISETAFLFLLYTNYITVYRKTESGFAMVSISE